ncbi:S8 family serine peptidase [Rhodomicrobium sp. Az07]|uniref:S8 family serine peptidase n=1 Tax=Rhodomicrobium sp. Az07 TaxID=2839034 RepID=UPI001BECBCB6|nr:S8 family serine peptidase [Rhodomicrobium sp. Az07]MBT3072024.1 S8 family serine peptidase [Rhodomicrobium sp. Az07]
MGPRFVELSRLVQQPLELAEDPTGIAPERALVFETAGNIQGFARAARAVGLEVIAEVDGDDVEAFPEGFEPARGSASIPQTLYATMPTLASAAQIVRLWDAHQADQDPPDGAAPWWKLFDRLLDLRPWGPEDRFPLGARQTIEKRLEGIADDDVIRMEFEIWPSASADDRRRWREEAHAKITELGGAIGASSSIAGRGFVYEALLARLPARAVRDLLADPSNPDGLGWVRGVQFILPQTIAQALPEAGEELRRDLPDREAFADDMPILGALLDGTPVAAHPALDGGVVIEDIHNLVGRSQVRQRSHATGMASLILRGDLEADGVALENSRLLCVPIVVDTDKGGRSPDDMLFVDLLHVALTRMFIGNAALAPDVFVVNLSIGIHEMRFGGRISALARLLDWWAYEHGVLFVISSGNILDALTLDPTLLPDFLAMDDQGRRKAVRSALRNAAYARSLLSPAEALNGLTVGAISEDRTNAAPIPAAHDIVALHADGHRLPAVTAALGLGPFRSIKPDLLETGGVHEFRAGGGAPNANLTLVNRENGLVVASPRIEARRGMRRTRGTSCAAALTSRAILQCAGALQEEGGPYADRDLSRRDRALLTRALSINAADWSEEAIAHAAAVLEELGSRAHVRAKEDVCRHYGHGHLSVARMVESPANGVTLVALSDLRKDQARIFHLPLPPALSGQRVGRSMRVTLAWFSPTDSTRARYRLASLQAMASDNIDGEDEDKDAGWGLLMQASGPDERMIGRGTVWSRRLIHKRLASPAYEDGETVPIRVQCQDASGGALSPDIDIRFAVAVTLEVEAGVQFDIHEELREKVRPRVRR